MKVEYKNSQVLILASPSASMKALASRLRRQGAFVDELEIRLDRKNVQFDVSAQARLDNGLAHIEENQTLIMRFLMDWFQTHTRPDLVIFGFQQNMIQNESEKGGSPLRYFIAATALLHQMVGRLSGHGRVKIGVCVGLCPDDFFGSTTARVGFRSLESYLKGCEKAWLEAGIQTAYTEYLDPENAFSGKWPSGNVLGFLRSLQPYSADEIARTILENIQASRLGQRPLRTELLFWLSKWNTTITGRRDQRVYQEPAAVALNGMNL